MRAEITYNFIPTLKTIDFFTKKLETILLEAINENIYFYCSIKDQWKAYLKYAIKENIIINNYDEGEFLFIRSINKETRTRN